jgi:Putative peptidoglycan binding domain
VHSFRVSLVVILGAALVVPTAFASTVHRAPTSGHVVHHRRASAHHRSHRVHGQQAIDPNRVREIQAALIRVHYLDGDPTGKWDASTVTAMQKFQADQGWQTKLTPDSRALKKLGLGADYSDAINARDASFNAPPPDATIPSSQVNGFTAASGSTTAANSGADSSAAAGDSTADASAGPGTNR